MFVNPCSRAPVYLYVPISRTCPSFTRPYLWK